MIKNYDLTQYNKLMNSTTKNCRDMCDCDDLTRKMICDSDYFTEKMNVVVMNLTEL